MPKPGYSQPHRHTERIQIAKLINRVENHALGKNKMTPTQLKAAEILLRKVTPDLKATEHSGEVKGDGPVKVIIGS